MKPITLARSLKWQHLGLTFRYTYATRRLASSSSAEPSKNAQKQEAVEKKSEGVIAKRKKTMAELDEELRQKLEGRSGDGGAAGLELEGGKPVAMKRGVRDNMFRLI